MKKIILFGTGKSAEIVRNCLKADVEIIVYLDNSALKQENRPQYKNVVLPKDIKRYEYDYIILASLGFESMEKQLIELGVHRDFIIKFFDYENCQYEKYNELFHIWKAETKAFEQVMFVKYNKLEQQMQLYCNNIKYEVMDSIQNEEYQFPIIRSSEEAIHKIISQNCSLCRFGDGEFEIMLGRNRASFQEHDESLGERLVEVLCSEESALLIALADNYGSLNRYTDDAANCIRKYLTPSVRQEHINLIDLKKIYFDAYLSRPYMIMNDKSRVKDDFDLLKKIWKNRKILIVEGEYTRMGVGNDLFSECTLVERIICPAQNAWNYYQEIYNEVAKADKEKLVLISLGPVATVLAYDLFNKGYQAIDIGHIDNEYEWFLQRTDKRTIIPGKYVNECMGGNCVEDILYQQCKEQIIAEIK